MMKRFLVFLIVATEWVSGYGGFGFKAVFVNPEGLRQRLNKFNYEWGGRDSFRLKAPLLWFEGQARGGSGPFTLGGGGAVALRSLKSDSLGAVIAGAIGSFKMGYPVQLSSFFELQPNLDFGINSLLVLVNSLEPGRSNFSRWFLSWGFNALPAVMSIVRIRSGVSSYFGIYLNGGYLLRLGTQNCYGNEPPPEFFPEGWTIDAGVFFGRMAPKPFRM